MTSPHMTTSVVHNTEGPPHIDNLPPRPVDFYYVEAMRALRCSDCPSDDDSGDEDAPGDSGNNTISSNEDITGRERSWSYSNLHEMQANEREHDEIGQLPSFSGRRHPGRLASRRHSDGMLLKDIKLVASRHDSCEPSHVRWADEDKKELTRSRPRKMYSRHPPVKPAPVRSILKQSSEESLGVSCGVELSDSEDEAGERLGHDPH